MNYYGRQKMNHIKLNNIHNNNNSGSSSSSSSSGSSSSSSKPLRIAIVDIDVHHGNGTEEIIRNLTPHQSFLPLPSSWAPVSKCSYKPWLNETDHENVLFSSINLYSPSFYPCSGGDGDNYDSQNNHDDSQNNNDDNQNNNKNSSNNSSNSNSFPRIINIGLTPIGPAWDPIGRAKLSTTAKSKLNKKAS